MVIALVIVGLIAVAHMAPFPFLLDAAAPGRVMWRAPAQPSRPTIYLTFDDGPNPTATPAVLDALARERVRATFFVIERHLTEETAPLVRRMIAEGHGVAIHTHTRQPMLLSPAAFASWIEQNAASIERWAGRRPCRAFRPHAGWRSASMLAGLARKDYQLVGWGWNAWDWNWFRARTADAIVARVTARARDGLIVVIHDGHHENPRADRQYAADVLGTLVPALRAKGFALGSICDVVGWPEPSAASDGTLPFGGVLPDDRAGWRAEPPRVNHGSPSATGAPAPLTVPSEPH
jgi:chitooligosaccharide deacetylase